MLVSEMLKPVVNSWFHLYFQHLAVSILFFLGFSCSLVGGEIDYQKDVQPIFAERCATCHGMDEATREAGLRLDIREDALSGGDSGEAAVVPGNPDASELIRRIMSEDDSEVMPPPDAHPPLSDFQIQTLRQWIEQGAEYQVHWSFTSPRKIELPEGADENPVDAFVREKLREIDMTPSPSADPGMMCRRLYMDVIGLPPSPDELQAFQRQGFSQTLEKLLASERYGEKWARHWMDVARYSDTNGYEKDLKRDQWIWRDWVIEAINQDLPYDQFVIQQIAGDLLPDATQDDVIATGFLRNSMVNEEGAIIPEQFRMVEMFDRMDCIGKAILGLTTQCAQCHSHKYDPITMEEYYGMFAFLNDCYESQSWVYNDEQIKRIRQIGKETQAAEDRLRKQIPDWKEKFVAWHQQIAEQRIEWKPLVFHDLNSLSGLNHPVQQPDHSVLMLGHSSADVYMIAAPQMRAATGLRLEALTHDDLPFRGPGRNSVGGWAVKEVEVFIKPDSKADWKKIPLVNASADFSQPEANDEEEEKSVGPVSNLIDGSDQTQWKADRGLGRRNAPSVAVLQFQQPLDLPAGCALKIAMRMSDMLGCCRFSLTSAPDPKALPIAYDAILAATAPGDTLTRDEEAAMFREWRKRIPEASGVNAEIDALWEDYPRAATSVLHLRRRQPHQKRETHLLDRGNWDQPLASLSPRVPAAFHPISNGAEPPRLRFARWLVDRRSPLAARVAVNRVWQNIFGVGLVETAEDFGTRSPIPEHRELLDWLAVDFMEHGWSQRHLLRTILSSSTYQQTSRVTAELRERDPQNRFLARAPRYRADAEVLRDIALSVSGLIHHKRGGPSVIPPVPKNVLDYNYVYPSYWKPAKGAERYRRAVYGFRKRSMPDPAMASLDSPNGDCACARRSRSNTPAAALTGLNETIFVEAARALALRILREGGSDDEQRVRHGYQLCVSRRPTAAETQLVLGLLRSQRTRIAEGRLDARAIATGVLQSLPDPSANKAVEDAATWALVARALRTIAIRDTDSLPNLSANATLQDAAAWTIVARVLLNLDETISRN